MTAAAAFFDLDRTLVSVASPKIFQRHLAEAVMVPVGLPVGRDVRELWLLAVVEQAGDPTREPVPVLEEALERDGQLTLLCRRIETSLSNLRTL